MSRKDTPAVQRFPPGTSIVERKHKPDGTVRSFSCELFAFSETFVMVLFTVDQPGAFNTPVPIPRGTRSYGYFWKNRPYNAYRFVSANGSVVAHRFDAVAGTRITLKEVHYRDLALDWWVLPGDVLLEEDREEFESLAADGKLAPDDVEVANQATRLVHSGYRHIIDELAELQRRYVL